MKIQSVEVLQVGSEFIGAQTFVQVATDTGTTGLGQSAGWGFGKGVGEVINELAPLLVGADPLRAEFLGQLLYRSRPFRGNLLSAAVSAIDIALWDIKGKTFDVPVWQLLGGNSRDRVRLHALVGHGPGPDDVFQAVARAVGEGFTAVKFDPLVAGAESLSMPALVEATCAMGAAAREAAGNEVDVIFELHRRLDPARALVVANALVQFRPLFIEDPIQIDSIDAQAEISKRIAAPVAIGERLCSIWEFSELLSHDVAIHVRPDLGLAGGLTGCKKIAAIAEAHHCGVIPHNFLGPALTAPTVHLCAAIPNLITMEYNQGDETGSAHAAISSAIVRKGGYCELPAVPGLGISLVEDYASLAPPIARPLTMAGMLNPDGSVTRAL
jgi:galactonate dehydratase